MPRKSAEGLKNAPPLEAFFLGLTARDIAWCAVGDISDLPNTPDNDVDIVVRDTDLSRTRKWIWDYAADLGAKVIQCLRHERSAYYYVIALPISGERLIKIDTCSDYIRNGRLFLSADWLLEGRRPAATAGPKSAVIVAAPSREFTYYLLKKVDKGHASNNALMHLRSLVSADRPGALSAISQYWTSDDAEQLLSLVQDGDERSFRDNIAEIRNRMTKPAGRGSSGLFLGEVARCLDRIAHPTGLFIAVLGPDGSGKSTLLEHIHHEIDGAFRRVEQRHLRPRLLERNSAFGAPVDNPHAHPTYDKYKSSAKLLYLTIDYVLGYWLKTKRSLIRSTFVVYDRYYHDIFADPKRYRYGGPSWLVRIFETFIPQPHLLIVLEAPAEVIHARKQEVSFDETERQLHAYRRLADSRKNARVINAAAPATKVGQDAVELIKVFLEQRARLREKVILG